MANQESDFWAFLTTFYPNIEWESMGLGDFDIEEGSVKLLREKDPFGRRLFIIGVRGDEGFTEDEAGEKAENVIRYFVGMVKLARGGVKINHDIHQHRKLDKDEYDALTDLAQGVGSVNQFFDDVEMRPPRDHETRIMYSADRFATSFLEELQPELMEFLHKPDIPGEHQELVKAVLGFSYDADLAGTRRQRFLSEYTAIDLMMKRLGRGGDSEESLKNLKDKLVTEGLLDESNATGLVEALDHFHDIRTGVYFGGKEPEGFESMPGMLIGSMVTHYMRFFKKQTGDSE